MKDKKVGHREVITTSILVISAFVLVTAVASATTIYVPEGGNQTIQQAVDNATAGDTIIVRDGTYNENVDVAAVAHLTIRSENGSANCIVNASNSSDHVFYVTADYVNISGFAVQNATGGAKAGIYLGSGVDHCNISENNASNNNYGIYLRSSNNNNLTGNNASSNDYYGISMYYSSNNNTLTGNNASYNGDYGISMYSSSNNNLTGNNASYNDDYGIRLYDSSNNTLTGNNASYNNYGIGLYYSSNNNTLTGNNASYNDDRGIYLDSSSNNNNLTGNNASYNGNRGIWLHSSSNNNNLTGNNASNNGNYGIYLDYSSNNNLTGNNASYNNYGIGLYYSSNNNLTGNNASYNGDYGIYLDYSSNNTLSNNTMSGNKYNFGVRGSTLSHYIQDIDTSNKVDTKPIYYWVDQKDQEVPNDAGFVGVVNSTNITVRDLNLTKNYEGVLFAYTNNSRIENVNASNNYYGIYLWYSSNNTLSNNTCKYNQYSGIYIYQSDFTTIGCDVTNNGNPDGDGYNIYIENSDNVIIDDVIVDEPIQGVGGSCPFLYTWNGDEFEFINEVEPGILGKYATTGEQLRGRMWEDQPFYKTPIAPLNVNYLLKIGSNQLMPLDGKYELRFTEELDELNYADLMELWTVDHVPGVEVYTDWTYRDNIFTVVDPIAPISAVDHNGTDVLSLISSKDWDEWISDWKDLEYVGMTVDEAIESNFGGYITLKLGNWTETPENLKLVITENKELHRNGEIRAQFKELLKYYENEGITENDRGRLWELRGGPRLQHKDADGKWVDAPSQYQKIEVAPGLEHSLKSFNVPITYVINLSGLDVPDYEIRYRVPTSGKRHHIDQLLVDTSPPQDVTTTILKPSYADIHYRGSSLRGLRLFSHRTNEWNFGYDYYNGFFYIDYDDVVETSPSHSGNLTRFGDVLPLLQSINDEFVIMGKGDELSMQFDYTPAAEGLERDFIFRDFGYYKPTYPLGDTVEQLPFEDMTMYPYDESVEHYDYDNHTDYIENYQTRVIEGHHSAYGIYMDNCINFTINNARGVPENAFDDEYGIYIDDCVEGTITNCSFTDGWYAAIYLEYSDDIEILNNTASYNDDYGIYLYNSDDIEILNNTASDNDEYGIHLYNSDDNNISCNLVAYNDHGGFYLGRGASSTNNNISYNNIINGDYNATTGGWEWNFYNEQSANVTAENNYWGTATSAVIAAGIKEDTGEVDYEPFLAEPAACAPNPGDDGDGVPSIVEEGAPGDGDGNDDGIPDRTQPNVTSLPTATSQGYMTLVLSNCSQLRNVTALTEAPDDPDYDYPYGLVSFVIPCENGTVEIIYHDAGDLTGHTYRKYGPTTPGAAETTAWYDFSTYATIAGNRVTLSFQDDRLGDDTGDDGTIVDQGGPGILGAVAAVPALTPIGLLALIVILSVVLARATVRKRKR